MADFSQPGSDGALPAGVNERSFGHSVSRGFLIARIVNGTIFGIGLIVRRANHCVGG